MLRRREHLKLQFAYLHPSRGRIVEGPDGIRTITLDRRLIGADRNAVLSHELVHDELDLLFPPGAPELLVQKCERLVEKVSDERLLPQNDLEEYVDSRGGQVIFAWQIAEDLDVAQDVAERAMQRVAWGF